MRRFFAIAALALAGVGSALHAEDMTRIDNRIENPILPSQMFLNALRHPKTLVLMSSVEDTKKYNLMIKFLADSGHNVTSAIVEPASELTFTNGNDFLYDNVIVTTPRIPSGKRPNSLTGKELVRFLEKEWKLPKSAPENFDSLNPASRLPPSVVIFASHVDESDSCNVDTKMSNFIDLFGFQIDQKTKCLVDSTVQIGEVGRTLGLNHKSDFNIKYKIKYKGLGLALDSDNSMIFPIVSRQSEDDAVISRKKTKNKPKYESLVVGFQGLNTWTRLVIAGSADLCSDESIHEGKDNMIICETLLDWASHRIGVSTLTNIQHHKVAHPLTYKKHTSEKLDSSNDPLHPNEPIDISVPFLYTVKDEIVVSADLWNLSRSLNSNTFQWIPLTDKSIQLDFTMIYPHIRDSMIPFSTANKSSFESRLLKEAVNHKSGIAKKLNLSKASHVSYFKAPHNQGIFKLVFKTKGMIGHTPNWIETIVPLRTYKHNDYERFLPCGYPYYASLGLTMGSTVVFIFLFLFAVPNEKEKIN